MADWNENLTGYRVAIIQKEVLMFVRRFDVKVDPIRPSSSGQTVGSRNVTFLVEQVVMNLIVGL